MRLRALLLICCLVAVLSGLALFTPMRGYPGEWLDAMFLAAVLIALVVALSMLVRVATKSFQGRIEKPEEDRPKRKG